MTTGANGRKLNEHLSGNGRKNNGKKLRYLEELAAK